jgi:hypothetical protein
MKWHEEDVVERLRRDAAERALVTAVAETPRQILAELTRESRKLLGARVSAIEPRLAEIGRLLDEMGAHPTPLQREKLSEELDDLELYLDALLMAG